MWRRDQGRCAFVAANGERCAATGGLEFHHTVPFAEGGAAIESGLELRCVAHNRWEANRWFGGDVTAYRGRKPVDSSPRDPGRTKLSPAGMPSSKSG